MEFRDGSCEGRGTEAAAAAAAAMTAWVSALLILLAAVPTVHAYYTPDYTLEFSNGGDNHFGYSVSVDHQQTVMVTSSRGSLGCRVYRYDAAATPAPWVYVTSLIVTNGYASKGVITPDGKTVLCTTNFDSGVWTYSSATQTWTQKGGYMPTSQHIGGYDISADGNTVLQTSVNADNVAMARVNVWRWDSISLSWVYKGTDMPLYNPSLEGFGGYAKMSDTGNTIVVGASKADMNGVLDTGAAVVYDYDEVNSVWKQRGPVISGPGAGTFWGSVAHITSDTGTIALSGSGQTAVYTYRHASSGFAQTPFEEAWVLKGDTLSMGTGIHLTEEGSCLMIGNPSESINGIEATGATRIFAYNQASGTWQQQGQELTVLSYRASIGHSAQLVQVSPSTFRLYTGGYYYNEPTGRIAVRDYTFTQATPTGIVYPDHNDLLSTGGDIRWGMTTSASRDGLTVALGARGVGGIPIYRFDTGQQKWVRSATLAPDGNQRAGISTGGDYVVMGTNSNFYVFQYMAASQTWVQKGDTPSICGNDNQRQGPRISSDGSVVSWSDMCNQGSVKVWAYDQGTNTWVQKGDSMTIVSADEDYFGFGSYMTPSGTSVIAGAVKTDMYGLADHGLVRVFDYDEGAGLWIQRGDDITDPNTIYNPYFFGANVQLSDDGNIAAVAAWDPHNTASNPEHGTTTNDLNVFRYDGTGWKKLGNTVARMSTTMQYYPNTFIGNFAKRMRFSLDPTGTAITVSEPYVSKMTSIHNGAVRTYMYSQSSDTWEPVTDIMTYNNNNAFVGYGLDVAYKAGGQVTVFAPGSSHASENRFYIRSFTLPQEPTALPALDGSVVWSSSSSSSSSSMSSSSSSSSSYSRK